MAKTYKNLLNSTAEYTRSYQGFRGVEMNASSSITSASRLSYAENMYRDYEADGADVVESIPGFRKLFSCNKKIHALYYQHSLSGNDHIIVHAEDKLFRYPVNSISDGSQELSEAIATINDSKSFGCTFGRYFYIIDGKSILCVDEDGVCKTISDSEATPYVPTTYISGEKHEERNLLTDLFKEEYYVSDPAGFYYSTDGIKYTISDADMRQCSVSGVDESVNGELCIPAYVTISGVEHKVTAIDNYALSKNTAITSVIISEGISKIGLFAFSKCENITTAIIPSSVTTVENGAFIDCTKLESIYLGDGITDIGIGSFANCPKLTRVYYSLDEESYKAIKNIGSLDGKTVTYETKQSGVTLAFPLHDDSETISSVKINGAETDFTTVAKSETVSLLTVRFSSAADATGIKVEICGKLKSKKTSFDGSGADDDKGVSGYDAVTGCTTAEVFDGRIFFSGNPKLPNTVFYTGNQYAGEGPQLYVGQYNYFNDGVGGYGVKCMLAVRDMLAVFKEGDDGSGSIFYHKKENTDSDTVRTIYPTAYVHSGVCAKGTSHSFLDDPVFITAEGLYALENQNINYQRNVACRSHNVNFRLLKEDLSAATLCTWLGYLVLGVNGKIYLADSRALFTHPTGGREYEWFFLNGIGTFSSDEKVYRYAYDGCGSCEAKTDKVGEAVPYKSVLSETFEDGSIHYYVLENGVKYCVYETSEKIGGNFSPAVVFLSFGKYLFFATESGDVCVFNNDKRGIAPDSVRDREDFDEDEYATSMADKIHPDYYSFADHAPRYVIKTALDNCDVPHLTKNTVKNSLVIKARSYLSENIVCEAVTDRGDTSMVGHLPISSMSFDDFSFESIPWRGGKYTSTALPESEKRWIEKQIVLSSNKYCAPISVYSISYRYVIKGKIKNNV